MVRPLTTGTDSITGTAQNNTVEGFVIADDALLGAGTTFNSLDSINGAGGVNRLNLNISGTINAPTTAGFALPVASVENVQQIYIRNNAGVAVGEDAVPDNDYLAVDASNFIGAEQIWNDRSTTDVRVTNMATGAVAGIEGNGNTTNGNFSFGYQTADAAATLVLEDGTTGGDVTITSAPKAVTVSSVGSTNTIGTLALGGAATGLTVNAAQGLTVDGLTGAALKTVTVTGDAATAATPVAAAVNDITSAVQLGALAASVTTVNAAAMTAGGVSATLVEAVTSFKGGAGTDTVTTAGLDSTTASIIDAGEGADVLRIGAVEHINTATKAKQYAGFEVLDALATDTAIDVSLFTNSTIGSLRVGGDNIFTNLNATQAANITVYADAEANFGIKDATNPGTSDSLSITVDDTLSATNEVTMANITAEGVETVSINAVDDSTVELLEGLADLQTLNLTGSGKHDVTSGELAINPSTVVNGSTATGALTIDFSASTGRGVAITGGSGADNITGTDQADIINGGAGDDTITGGEGNDTLTGGAGSDTFVFANSAGNNGNDTITDFAVGTGNDVLDVGAFLNAPNALTAVTNLTGDATVADNQIITVNFAAEIADTDFGTAGAEGFDLLFADGGKAFNTTVANNIDAVLVVQGTDETQVYFIDVTDTTTLTAGMVGQVSTLVGIDNADTFIIGNFA